MVVDAGVVVVVVAGAGGGGDGVHQPPTPSVVTTMH